MYRRIAELETSEVENIPSVTWVADQEGNTTFVSPNIEKVYGYTPEEIYEAGHSLWFGRIHPDDVERVKKAYELLFLNNMFDIKYRIQRKDGNWIWLHDRAVSIYEKDHVKYAYGVFSDITKRKRMEEALHRAHDELEIRVEERTAQLQEANYALRESEEKYRTLIDNMQDGVFFIQDANIQFANEAFARMAGYTVEEVIGKDFRELAAPEDLRMVEDRYFRRQAGEDMPSEYEFRMLHRDGKTRIHVSMNVGLITYRGRVASMGTVKDITDRKRAEEALSWEAKVNAAIANLSTALISSASIEDISSLVLEHATFLTGSKFGYVGYLDPQTGYLICPAITRDIWNQCQVEDKNIIINKFNGICGWVLNNRKALLINTLAGDPRSSGTPPGHAPIHRFLSAPALIDKTLVGQVSVANADHDYTERDLALIERLATLYAIAIQRMLAGEELRKERDFSLSLIQASPVFFVAIDASGKTLMMNKAMLHALGYTIDEVTGKDYLLNFVPEADRNLLSNIFEKIVTLNEPALNENRVLTRDGRELLVEWHGRPVFKANGDFDYFFGLGTDITERKRAEEALRESEERYRRLVEFSPDGIIVHNLRELVFVNRATAKILGAAKPEELIGKPVRQIVHPDYWETVKGRLYMEKEGKEAPLIEEKFVRLDGTLVDVEVVAIPCTHQGTLEVHAVVRDITERKLALEKIREQAELLDKAQDAITVQDLEHRIIFWNKGAVRLYGFSAQEAIGKSASELLYREDLSQLIDAQKSVIEKGEWTGELYQLTKDGTKIIVESHWTLVCDNEGELKSILIINTDITAKKNLEAQLLRAQRMESIGTLASGIAHDINNVLSPIMLSLQLLQERFTDEHSQKLLNILERSAQRGAGLIKQVQSFTRGMEGERIDLQVTHIISEISQIAKETFPRSIEIRTDIKKDLFPICGDATQLHQVLMNLCVNARDAMPDGGILSISAENIFIDENFVRMNIEAKVGPYIVITVLDTGTGIPAEIVYKIFDPFFTTKEFGKGTGLGLSTSLAIVKGHGGFINVSSEVGKGTTFKIYLPAVATATTQKVEKRQYELPAGHGESILVVDDEAHICEITSSTLQAYGYRAIIANDGAQAVALYVQNRDNIKAILMDMMMPVMDGPESIKELRRINPDVKIIAVSGLTEKDKLANVADTYVHAFLPKPYTAQRLLKTIHEVLSTKIA